MQNFRYFTEAKMARQHFQLIADVISNLDVNTTIKKSIAEKFADAFEDTNNVDDFKQRGMWVEGNDYY